MKFKVDNIRNYSKTSGWICGQFLNDEILKNQNIEVNFSTFLPGHTALKHSHPKSKMVIRVLNGKIKMEFDNQEYILMDQDFAFLEEGVPESVIEVFEPTSVLCIRTPSVPNNKEEL
jgi:quercetin dioxygenase-like cupin family protein